MLTGRFQSDPQEASMPHLPASSVLDNITVLDLTRVRSGPTATRQLCDWGPNVIKIEIPESGIRRIVFQTKKKVRIS